MRTTGIFLYLKNVLYLSYLPYCPVLPFLGRLFSYLFFGLIRLMAVKRLNNQGVRGLAPLLPSGRAGARINGHPVYSRLLLVSQSRYGVLMLSRLSVNLTWRHSA